MVTDNTVGSGGIWDIGLLLARNRSYTIKIYVNAPAVILGSVITSLTVEYESEQEGVMTIPNVAGQTITLGYKVSPRVASVTPFSTTIVNDVEIEYSITIAAPSTGAIAMKQLAYRFNFADNGGNDTLRLESIQWFRGNQKETDLITFSDSGGTATNSLSELVVNHRKLYITYTAGKGEVIIPAGKTETFTIKLIPRGFGLPADGDAVSIVAVTDQTLPAQNYSYVNKGTIGQQAKLYSSPGAHSSATVQNFIWSDMAANPHSGIYGVASNDWKNGYGIVFNTVPIIFHK